MVHFDLGLSLSAAAAPNPTGSVTIAASLEERGEGRHFFHEQIVNLSTGVPFETWELGVTIHRGSTSITGDAGNLPTSTNQLTTTTTNQDFGYGLTDSTGTPPPPPPPRTDSLTEALDFLQTGLDAAGLVPVLGEPADAISAGISAGRGNFGDAMLSMAAMIPLGGQAVTVGKFANKATKAVAKNADKLDNIAAGVGDIAANGNRIVAGAGASAPRGVIGRIGDLSQAERRALQNIWEGGPRSQLPLRTREQLAEFYSGVAGRNPVGSAQAAFNQARADYLLGRGPNPGRSVNEFAERFGITKFKRGE